MGVYRPAYCRLFLSKYRAGVDMLTEVLSDYIDTNGIVCAMRLNNVSHM